MSRIRTKSTKSIGIDIRSGCFEEECKAQNINFINANAEELPFKDSIFDVVVMSEVLEHIINPARAMKGVERVLKKGGVFLFTAPNKGALDFLDVLNLKHRFPKFYCYFNAIFKIESDIIRANIKENPFHRHYSVQGLKDILPGNFKIETIQYHGFLLCYIIDIISSLYRKTTERTLTFLYKIAKYDYGIHYGSISYGLVLKFRKL